MSESKTHSEIERGELLIEVLGLRLKKNGRVNTSFGDKTPLGLFMVVQRIINDKIIPDENYFIKSS